MEVIFWILVGFAMGMIVMEMAWRSKVREKARTGTRIAMQDELYRVELDSVEVRDA